MNKTIEPLITVTDSALQFFKKQLVKEQAEFVRLSVSNTGCNGLSYEIDMVKSIPESDVPCVLSDEVSFSIARDSVKYLAGLSLDYVPVGNQLGMKKLVFRNPNARGHCGCGESFNAK